MSIGGRCPECGTSVDTSLYAASSAAPPNGMAITAMVFGILSLVGACCCPVGLTGIIGLIFGIVAMNQLQTGNYSKGSRGMAIAGLVCSGIAMGIAIVWIFMAMINGI